MPFFDSSEGDRPPETYKEDTKQWYADWGKKPIVSNESDNKLPQEETREQIF